MTIYVVIPAFNESSRIISVLKGVKKYVSHIVVVDDGSTDNTSSVAMSYATVLRHGLNLGQGAALQTGFAYCQAQHADIVITFDADGQFDPADLPKFIDPLVHHRADVVLGSRFLGTTYNMPFSKLITLKLGIFFTYLFSNLQLTDTHNGFRGFNSKGLSTLHLTQNRMAHASEILHLISLHHLRLLEVPVTVRYYPGSQSSLAALKIFFDLLRI